MVKLLSIVKKPLITEKALKDAQKGIYTFSVEKSAGKKEIAREIESLFKVHVKNITTQIVKGKEKTVGRNRQKTIMPDKKKARVRLASGEKIEVFDTATK